MHDTSIATISAAGKTDRPRRRKWLKIVAVAASVLAVVLLAASIGSYLYWRSFYGTPQYSLALLVESARNDDQATIDNLIDTDASVDDFLPQVTAKAIELYGRGLPPKTIARVERIAAPLMPAIKQRARQELPRLIRQKTERFENVPFAAMVLGADKYLNIDRQSDTAFVKSKLPEHTFEVKMQRNGDVWKIVGVRDDELATAIAQKIGQDIIAVAANGGTGGDPQRLGIGNVGELLRQAQEIFK